MKYFELFDDVTIPGRWHLGQVVFDDGIEPRLRAAIPLCREEALRATVTHCGTALEFCLTSLAVPIASRRLARAIGGVAGSDLQSVHVDIAGADGMEILNAVRAVSCLDESRSEFIKWTMQDHRSDLAGQYRQVTKLTVDPKAIPSDAHFFRIEGWLIALVVSDAVRSAMIRSGCLGAMFIDINP